MRTNNGNAYTSIRNLYIYIHCLFFMKAEAIVALTSLIVLVFEKIFQAAKKRYGRRKQAQSAVSSDVVHEKED